MEPTNEPAVVIPDLTKFSKEKVLKDYFGFDAFRGGQAQVIDSLLRKESALAIFPTGGGKSICYQLPCIMFPPKDLTLVVSPLIALMKDQTDSLKKRGIQAEMISSVQSAAERQRVRANVKNGVTRILYIAPEQVNNEGTKSLISDRNVALVAVDEAHCISEWGHAFRPDYLRLSTLVKDLKAQRVLCLTATATPKVGDDICKAFNIQERNSVRTSFYRPNLHLDYQLVTQASRDKDLLTTLKSHHKGPTIVYVTLQKTAEKVADLIRSAGYDARPYHAGMLAGERTAVQNWFMMSDNCVVVATIAFGMGIDKPNIRLVIHYNVAKSLEGYAQEIGRAGRDGNHSRCHTLLCPEDLPVIEAYTRLGTPSAQNIYDVLHEFFRPNGKDMVEVGTKLDVAMKTLGKENDVYEITTRMLIAFVDIYHKHVKTLTPKYSNYQMQTNNSGEAVRAAVQKIVKPAAVCQAVLKHLNVKRVWSFLDVEAAGKEPGCTREQVVGAIGQLETLGCKVKAAGVLNVFQVTSRPKNIEKLARLEHARFTDREAREIDRITGVVDLITAKRCQTRVLMEYFGEQPSERSWKCGHCRYCEQKQALVKPSKLQVATDKPPSKLWTPILKDSTIPKDDPRLLARFALGERSPFVTKLNLAEHKLFGSLEGQVTFAALLRACEDACHRNDRDIINLKAGDVSSHDTGGVVNENGDISEL